MCQLLANEKSWHTKSLWSWQRGHFPTSAAYVGSCFPCTCTSRDVYLIQGKKLFIFSVKTENNRKWRNQKEEIHTRTDNPANSDHFSVSYPVFYEFSSSRFVILFIYCVLTWAESTGCSTQPLHSHGRNSTTLHLRCQQRIWHVDTFSANILTNWSRLFH